MKLDQIRIQIHKAQRDERWAYLLGGRRGPDEGADEDPSAWHAAAAAATASSAPGVTEAWCRGRSSGFSVVASGGVDERTAYCGGGGGRQT
jgi:hypothetical protein